MNRTVLIGGLFASLFLGGVARADHPPGRVYVPAPQQGYRHAPRADWAKLGDIAVGSWRDRDVLHVGPQAGRFSRLRVVSRDQVFIRGLRVTFASGRSMELDLRGRFDGHGRAADIDLPGDARAIASIELLARGRPRWGRGGSRVEIWGELAAHRQPWIGGGGYPRGWASLGVTTLDGRRDRDTIHVGRELGRFRQLMVVFHDGAARIEGVLVTFASGETVRLPVRAHASGGNPVIDLPGDARVIRAVTLVGGSAGWGRGGRVEVLGS